MSFPIDARTTKTAVVNFEPGDMIAPAFEQLEFEVRRTGGQVDALVEPGRRWTYLRDR